MNRIAPLALITTVLVACGHSTEKSHQMTLESIDAVMQKHTAELLKIPGVTGLAIGELEDKTPCIWVMVVEESKALSQAIPDSLDGYPVRIVVSGEIKPLSGQ